MHSCDTQGLSRFQKRFKRRIEILLGICVAVSILLQAILERHHLSLAAHYGIALIAITPIIATIALIAQYLRSENDEYMREVVVKSLLWGFAVAAVAGTFLGYVYNVESISFPIGNVDMDIFVLTASWMLEFQLRRNR